MSEKASGRAPDFILGLDLGQIKDYAALAILERRWVTEGSNGQVRRYNLRHLKRWPLRTGYQEIVDEVCNLVQTEPLKWPLLAIDRTGVGVAFVDMLRQAHVKASLNHIVITGGHEITREGAEWHVPKKELVTTIQLLLQTQRIKFAPLPLVKILQDELLNFKVKININAHEGFEAWRERDHDDILFAVTLAAWLGERHVALWSDGPPPVIDNPPKQLLHERVFGRGAFGCGAFR